MFPAISASRPELAGGNAWLSGMRSIVSFIPPEAQATSAAAMAITMIPQRQNAK
jgi:hypothetical protein